MPASLSVGALVRPEHLLEPPGLAAGLDERVRAGGHVGQEVGSTLGQHVGGPQPAVVLVDAQQPRLHLEEPHHVDDGVDGGQVVPSGSGRLRLDIWRSAMPIMPMERSPM